MTERTLELALLLPREAECASCVDEVSRELGRLEGVHAVEADVRRGLITLRFDEARLPGTDVELLARRAGAQAHCADHCPLAVHAHGPLDLRQPLPGEDGAQRRVLHVTGMDCADCALKLEGALRREPGVRTADVNFGSATLAVVLEPVIADVEDVYRAIRRLGYDTVERRATAAAAPTADRPRRTRGFWLSEPRAVLTLVSGAFVLAGFGAEALASAASPWLFALAIVSGGALVARSAAFSLRARQVDMNVLMTLAVVGAAAIGQWSEAGLVTFLYGLGTVLQAATLERTRRAISGLMELAPAECTVDRDGAEERVPAAAGRPGDVIVLRPGERAAVDGVVVDGAGAVDQAPVTGESAAIVKARGDEVFAGSIVEGGALRLRALSSASDNTIAKIVHLVEEAQAQRAPAEGVVDRFAARYTPIVVVGAAVVAFIPPLLGASFAIWFYRGLALLIISCPCALVISTPVSILAALARATRNGVLIKGGLYLEQAAKLTAVAFDKTGTLTSGRPQVTDVVCLDGMSRTQLLGAAAAVERLSEHPLARAIVERATVEGLVSADVCVDETCGCREPEVVAAASCGCTSSTQATTTDGRGAHGHEHVHEDGDATAVDGRLHPEGHGRNGHGPDVRRFRAIPGRGVRAEVDGRLYFVGRPQLLGTHADDPSLLPVLSSFERQGKTTVVVGDEDGPLGVVAISDPLRPEATAAIAALRRLGVRSVTMLTGDNRQTAAAVAAEAGIDDVRAGLLPGDKVAAVRSLGECNGAVAMIGDGVNDAPALAAAGLGIAMGAAGTDAALETADIALMGDDLAQVPETIRLARRTTRIIWQNIIFSIAVKAVFLALAPLGLVSLWMAVFADMGTSLLVTGNGLRLFRR